jgi:TPR repeat protein
MISRPVLLAFISILYTSQVLADLTSADNARESGDYATAIAEYRTLAEAGDNVAQATLGYMLYIGEGVSQNYQEAITWYGPAAEQGNADAQYNLAVAYAFGEGTEQNFTEAVRLYSLAAEQDHAIAQYSLGLSYTYGEGVERDPENAAYWYTQSADNGYVRSQVLLGSKYHTGDGVTLNYQEAASWYAKAAEQGDAIAQFNLGSMYRSGTGVEQDINEAMKWYQLSSQQGYITATDELTNLERALAAQDNVQQSTSTTVISNEESVINDTVEIDAPTEELDTISSNMDIIQEVDEAYVSEQAEFNEAQTELSTSDSSLLTLDNVDPSLPGEISSVTEQLLSDSGDTNSYHQEVEGSAPVEEIGTESTTEQSSGFFSRLFSRSNKNKTEPSDNSETVENNNEELISDINSMDDAHVSPMEEKTEINEPEQNIVAESKDKESSGFFSRLFSRDNNNNNHQTETSDNTEDVKDNNEELISDTNRMDDADVSPMEEIAEINEPKNDVVAVAEVKESGGFFSRLFKRTSDEDTNIDETPEPEVIAMAENATLIEVPIEDVAEIDFNRLNNLFEQGLTELAKKNYDEAVRLFRSAAAQGDPMAQHQIGTLHYQGLGLKQDYDGAALWYRRAAEQGNVDAQYSLGNMFLMGEGIPQDDVQAQYWYNEAATQGHTSAMHNLQNLERFSETNELITEDISSEIEVIDDTLTRNVELAMDTEITESGIEKQESSDNIDASIEPMVQSNAPTSLAIVDYERGLAYSFGEGVAKNLDAAFNYFKKSAENNYPPAQYKLGIAYAYAEGTAQDKSQAVYWYQKAALQGHSIAQRNLGVIYENGDGIDQNKAQALAWYSILAESGNVMDVRRQESLSNELTADEIVESERIKNDLLARIISN